MFKAYSLRYKSSKLIKRYVTVSQTTAALRPFFFSVHPDLFGKHPKEKAVNEASLKVLSEHLEQLRVHKPDIKPKRITFYVRNINKTSTASQTFRQVSVSLLSSSVRGTIEDILKSCDLPHDFVQSIEEEAADFPRPVEWDPSFYAFYGLHKFSNKKEKSSPPPIRTWMRKNVPKAIDLQLLNKPFVSEAEKVCTNLCLQIGLQDIRWDSGWNYTLFLACLGAFQRMLYINNSLLEMLKGKILVFGPVSGVNIHGEVMLSSEDVPHTWWRVFSSMEEQYDILDKLSPLEEDLSHLLHGIQVSRQKQHTYLTVEVYQQQLSTLVQSLSSVNLNKILCDLSQHHIVVDSAGSSPQIDSSGNFRIPFTHPPDLIADFITSNVEKAATLARESGNNQSVENELRNSCVQNYQLESLRKDTNIRSVQMIQCCRDLLDNPYEIQVSLKGCCIVVSTYYTVMQNGNIYLPWNWCEAVR